nr:D475 [uncultured bacterium]
MAERDKKGRWQPGSSPNPAGRKPGSGAIGRLRASIASHLPAIIERLVEQALEGDTAASRLLLERCVAPLKATELPEPVNLPDGSLSEQGRAVLAAVAAGELSTGQGAALLSGLGALARVVEIDELAARVAELEKST